MAIVAGSCDTHNINIASKAASGLAGHVKNLNKNLETSLEKLHSNLVRLCQSSLRKDVLAAVQKDNGRKKTMPVTFAGKTRWDGTHDETKIASINQHDLDATWVRLVAYRGVDEELWKEHKANIGKVLPLPHDWKIYEQYESGMEPLRILSKTTQTARVGFHMELFEMRRCMELLATDYFGMYENVSAKVGAAILTKRLKNRVATKHTFSFSDIEVASRYLSDEEMTEEVAIARRLGYRLLGKRCKLLVPAGDRDYETDLDQSVMKGLDHAGTLPGTKMFGALVHPIFRSEKLMVMAGVCTSAQYSAGLKALLTLMSEQYERTIGYLPGPISCDDDVDENLDDDIAIANIVSPSSKIAQDEWVKFASWKRGTFQPTLAPRKVLGAHDENGQPKKPVLCIGEVTVRGSDLESGKNLADYVDTEGYFDIVLFFEDHTRYFPLLSKVVIGKFAPHISTEVDCESLFSEAGHLSNPLRSRTTIRTFERLVIAKHRLQRIYCCEKQVHEEYMRRLQEKDWDEKMDREDLRFLREEKKVYLEMFPDNADMFEEDNESEDDESVGSEDGLEYSS